YYGGLRKQIPFTFWSMMAGTLAITGVGIYWFHAGFAGFHSKDAIIEAAFAAGSEVGQFAFFIGVLAALLTSFYSWRLMFLTFWGKPRWIQSEHIQHSVHKTPEQAGDDTTGGYHPHESPLTMLVPLGLLSIGAVFAGFVFSHAFLDDGNFWNGAVAYDAGLMHAMHEVPLWVKLSATVAMLTGLGIAYFMYFRGTDRPARLAATFNPLYQFFFNKWYFDELYNLIFIRPAFWLGRKFWKTGDEGTIDRFGPNGIAAVIASGSGVMKRFQSGFLYTYALVMLLGLAAAATWIIVGGASS
ncbi:MAG: NADH-quinone oxidoreductase subunit L, partial [Sphingorhabdus sp.]